jgi:SAM-dependent methyltransferase
MTCDLCGASAAETVFEGGDRRFGFPGRFTVVRCEGCGLLRTEPQPEDPGAYYPSGEYYSYVAPEVPPVTGAAVLGAYGRPVEGSRALRVAAALARRRLGGLPPGPPGDVLDVGCGSGAMLLALRAAGWRAHGVELDPGAVAAARAAGLEDVRAGDLLDADLPAESFDVVRFWHSLEHVRSPRAQLEEARRLVRPGGALVLGVPNAASLLARTFRARWFYLDVPRHLWHFDRPRLVRLVDECGFTVERVRNVTSGSAILGTWDYLRNRPETAVKSARALYAVQPAAALLDVLRVGDEIELVARR